MSEAQRDLRDVSWDEVGFPDGEQLEVHDFGELDSKISSGYLTYRDGLKELFCAHGVDWNKVQSIIADNDQALLPEQQLGRWFRKNSQVLFFDRAVYADAYFAIRARSVEECSAATKPDVPKKPDAPKKIDAGDGGVAYRDFFLGRS